MHIQMRVALLLYGKMHIYTQYRPHCSHYEELINFIGSEHTIDIFYSGDHEQERKIQVFVENYKPVKYVSERIIHPNILSGYPGRLSGVDNEALYDVGCELINKLRVSMLLEEHMKATDTKYDFVICMRLDLKINSKLVLSDSILGDNTIYIPTRDDLEESMNDNIAFGNFEVMKKYCELYKYSQYLLESKLSIPSSEHLHLANLKYNTINIVKIPFSYYIHNE